MTVPTGDARAAPPILGTKHLDWLRGVAAFAVVAFYFSRRLELLLVGHFYLGVDFFFVLSGFVIAKAYTARLANDRLTGWSFFVTRAIRLLPMVMAGIVLAALVEIGRPGIEDHVLHLREGLTVMVLGSILIPVIWTTTLEHTVLPLNAPIWMLFLEAISEFIVRVLGALSTGTSEFGQVPETLFPRLHPDRRVILGRILVYHWRDKAPWTCAVAVTIALITVLLVLLVLLLLIVLAASNSKIDLR